MSEPTHHATTSDSVSGMPDTWPLSALDAARLAGVSERTIRRAIARGELAAAKHGGVYRISPDALADYRAHKGIGFPHLPEAQSSLPVLPTSLIGRQIERAAAQRLLLEEGIGLLTLIGPGGVGKTHLALCVAAEAAESFEDGACFVDLSPVRDPALVLPRIAHAIGVRDTGRRDAGEAVVACLRPRQVLLVLDNCEQVLAAAPLIAALLAACPALQILSTSRAPLRLRAEHLLPVPPLPVPSDETSADLLAESDAVRLFLDRARAVDPAGVPAPDEVPVVADICRRLDGLPLAIELAAARLALLSPRALLDQLSDRLRMLTDGPRDLPDRQRTMSKAIAWSYDLLSPRDQALFRRLAVFVDGFDLGAAIAVAGASPADVLDRIGALVEQSLLRRVEGTGGKDRYACLETVREFAWVQLQEHGESDAIRGLHAEHFLNLAEHIESMLYGSEMRRWLDRFEAEYPNCLAALAFFVEIGDATRELRLAGMLSEYWYYRGQISEGIAALQGALARGAEAPPGPRARAMSVLGFLHWTTGAVQQALLLLSASVPLARKAGDVDRLAKIQYMWAHVLRYQEGRREEAISLLEDVIELTAGHQPLLDVYPAALDDLGDLWLLQGDRERGLALLNQALSLFQDLADQLGVGQAHLRLGRLARRDGATRRAADHFGQSLRAYRETGIVTQVGLPLAELGQLVADNGYPAAAARIAGMIQAISDRTGAAFDDGWAFTQPRGQTAPSFAMAAFASGRSLPFNDALAEAIAVADALAAGSQPPGETRVRPSHPPVDLSVRERDVLALLAQRYTAPEMADQLFLSVRTIERHVANIYNKLGVNSRRAAASAAARHGLV